MDENIADAAVTLPQELIEKIIDDVADTSSPSRLGDLRRCSLTARSFRPRTIYHLFRRLNTTSIGSLLGTTTQWHRFDAMLSQSPHIARSYTVMLLMYPANPCIDDSDFLSTLEHIFSMLVHIQQIVAYGAWFELLLHPSISRQIATMPVRFVNLAHGVFNTISRFVSAFDEALQGLESIKLGTTKVVDHAWPLYYVSAGRVTDSSAMLRRVDLCNVDASIVNAIADGRLGRLTALEVLRYQDHSYREALRKFLACTSLVSLTLSIDGHGKLPVMAGPLPLLVSLEIDFDSIDWLSNALEARYIGPHLRRLSMFVKYTTAVLASQILPEALLRFDTVMFASLDYFEGLKRIVIMSESGNQSVRHFVAAHTPNLSGGGFLLWE